MAENKRGKHSFVLPQMPVITAWASVAGKKEGQGPLAQSFDVISGDTYFGQKTWEQAEKQMQKIALDTLIDKAGVTRQQIGLVFSGDLLNQCIGSSFTLRNTGIPHIGLYGACSTMAEGLLMASMAVCGGFSDKVIALTSSHFASSERQYRFPLGYGGQRTPTAQWTVTGAGAALVCSAGKGPRIESCTIGTVTDLGIKDANNMGAAMAPVSVKLAPYPVKAYRDGVWNLLTQNLRRKEAFRLHRPLLSGKKVWEDLRMESIFESMGGTYRQAGDYMLPDLTLPEETESDIGIWGLRHARFLKQHHRFGTTIC